MGTGLAPVPPCTMTTEPRYCPLCEVTLDLAVCPVHQVPTVESALLRPNDGELVPGAIVADKFRIEEVVGRGGMGCVFRAVQLSMGRPVALKVIHLDFVAKRDLIKRFYREALAASRLDHPNIVKVHDFGIDTRSGRPYIAMEFLVGRSLEALLDEEGPASERRAAALLAPVARALVEAHGSGLIHRDLKPANIHVRVIDEGEELVKLLDFGIAKVLRRDEGDVDSLTGTGLAIGTPQYMSPEQVKGEPIDFRTDLYALGCVLYEACAGRLPFNSPEPLGLAVQHLTEAVPPLPERLSDGRPPSPALKALLYSLLAKDRSDRPASTLDVARSLVALGRATPHPEPMPDIRDMLTLDAIATERADGAMDIPPTDLVPIDRRRATDIVDVLHVAATAPVSTNETVILDGVFPTPRPARSRRRVALALSAVAVAAGLAVVVASRREPGGVSDGAASVPPRASVATQRIERREAASSTPRPRRSAEVAMVATPTPIPRVPAAAAAPWSRPTAAIAEPPARAPRRDPEVARPRPVPRVMRTQRPTQGGKPNVPVW